MNVFGIPMSTLCFAHTSLFFSAVTSVEQTQGSFSEPCCVPMCCPAKDGIHEYELGVIAGLNRIFGSWPFAWFLPISCYHKSGFEFARRPLYNPQEDADANKKCKEIDIESYKERVEKKVSGKILIYNDLAIINNTLNRTVA